MPIQEDFLTNVETAFLSLFTANDLLREYNWQRWDSDAEAKLPRGLMGLKARRDPEDTPYHRIEVEIRLEGRPTRQKLSVVVNELKDVLEATSETALSAASGDTVQFMGRAISVSQDRPIVGGLRTWTFGFVIYALPMV
jgi:hypothetical protein